MALTEKELKIPLQMSKIFGQKQNTIGNECGNYRAVARSENLRGLVGVVIWWVVGPTGWNRVNKSAKIWIGKCSHAIPPPSAGSAGPAIHWNFSKDRLMVCTLRIKVGLSIMVVIMSFHKKILWLFLSKSTVILIKGFFQKVRWVCQISNSPNIIPNHYPDLEI